MSLAQTRNERTLYAVDVTGGGRSSAMSRRMSANRWDGDLGHLERDIAPMVDDLWPILMCIALLKALGVVVSEWTFFIDFVHRGPSQRKQRDGLARG